MNPRARVVLPLLAAAVTACAGADRAASPTDRFWANLTALCGNAYEGRIVEAPANDTAFFNRALVMHVRECGDSVVRVPFHVGEARSRTWVISQTVNGGLRLKHDHRHLDGTADSLTQYGGDARLLGDSVKVEFPADSFTAALIPAAKTNVWTIEIVPGRAFVYALRREGTDRRFRVDFDLSRTVPAPPAPWGAR